MKEPKNIPPHERTEQEYRLLVHMMEMTNGCMETFKKMERQIINEPESDSKFEKLEMMRIVIDRLSNPVNSWKKYIKRLNEAAEAEAEEKRKKEAKKRFEKEQQEFLDRQDKPQEQTYNIGCRHYCMTTMPGRNGGKPVVEHRCDCGMDMTYCGKHCAFATNAIKSTPAYDAPITMNHRRVRKND